jgi:hypothetical protein
MSLSRCPTNRQQANAEVAAHSITADYAILKVHVLTLAVVICVVDNEKLTSIAIAAAFARRDEYARETLAITRDIGVSVFTLSTTVVSLSQTKNS